MRGTVDGGMPVREASCELDSQTSSAMNAESKDSARASGSTIGALTGRTARLDGALTIIDNRREAAGDRLRAECALVEMSGIVMPA